MKKILLILLIAALFPLPSLAVVDVEIERAKQFSQTAQGQELIKSPEGQKMIGELSGRGGPKTAEESKPEVAAGSQSEISVIESAFGKGIPQFGYDIFLSSLSNFTPVIDVPVGPDYMVGPGDSFNITLWGVAEGVFKTAIDREGNIVLPKVGVVHVAGLNYSDMKPVIETELSKYYEKINVGVSIADLRAIRVFILGEVAKPGSYSISSLSTLFNALFAAGGPTKKGTLRNIELIRNGRAIANVDLYKFILFGDSKNDIPLQSGDTIFISIIGPTMGITGNVYRPAIYEIKGSPDLSDLINLAGGVLPTSYLNRIQIERVVNHEKKMILDKKISVSSSGSKFGIPLKNMDFVNVYNIYSAIGNMINLEGSVKYPGPYELKTNARLKDIVSSPAMLTYSAYLPKAEVIRIDKATLQIKVIQVNLQKLFSGDETQNIELEWGDQIVVSTEQKTQEKIQLLGEFKLPGSYTIEKGERLSSLIERAGGYTVNAYLYGAVFTRSSARSVQQTNAQKMVNNLEIELLRKQKELAAFSATVLAEKQAELNRTRELVERLKSQVPEGRVVIQLDDPEKMKGSSYDVELEDGDQLVVPAIPKIINVAGEVYNPSSLIYFEKLNVSDYINRLGGFTKNADQGSFYVLRANGSVISRDQGYNLMSMKLNPGDSIIVPQQLDHYDFFASVSDFTKWFYEAAVGYAVIHTVLK